MSDQKKATVDDLVQEMRWLNENVNLILVEVIKENQNRAEVIRKRSNRILIIGAVLCGITGLAAMFDQLSREQGSPSDSAGTLLVATAAVLFYGVSKR